MFSIVFIFGSRWFTGRIRWDLRRYETNTFSNFTPKRHVCTAAWPFPTWWVHLYRLWAGGVVLPAPPPQEPNLNEMKQCYERRAEEF